MAYTKYYQTWKNLPSEETPIVAEALNNMDEGILAASTAADNAKTTANEAKTTANEAKQGLESKLDSSSVLTYEQTMSILMEGE